MTTIDVRDKNYFELNVSIVQYKEQLGKTVNEARLSFVKLNNRSSRIVSCETLAFFAEVTNMHKQHRRSI